MNINTDIDINRMQKFIYMFILNGYRYNLNTRNMDIIMDITYIIKLYDYGIKDITNR